MPFYEYVCAQCGAQTEMLRKISDPPATECPVCHAQALTKVISAAGFRLKGGGWYETDFKSDNKKNLAGTDSSAAPAAASDSSKSSGSDSPAATPAATPAPAATAKSSTDV
jgi:putative FmdB family regulatory protein